MLELFFVGTCIRKFVVWEVGYFPCCFWHGILWFFCWFIAAPSEYWRCCCELVPVGHLYYLFFLSAFPDFLCGSFSDFSNLFSHCQRLQVLSMQACVLLDNSAMLTLARHRLFLASLCIAGCHMVSDRGLQALAQRCQHLQALDISRTKVMTVCLQDEQNTVFFSDKVQLLGVNLCMCCTM